MTSDIHLDGNSLGGLLYDLFGREMTHHLGCCRTCGTVAPIGSLLVYPAPGDVMRCSTCGSVVMVAVTTPQGVRISFESLRWLELGPRDLPS